MKAPVVVESHAVDQFIERHKPGHTFDQAKLLLYTLLRNAVHVEEILAEQQEIWRLPGDILICTKNGVVKTVLPAGATKPVARRGNRRGGRFL